uniref:dolichyl-phosphate-mannose--protein mannosyltransferase n=1 Tax=Haemonchus contortus TaxID=6289 RepID=A0A7I4XW60_HAECO
YFSDFNHPREAVTFLEREMKRGRLKPKRREHEVEKKCPVQLWDSSRLKVVMVVVLAIGPFLPSLNGDFVFDDFATVLNNPVVNGRGSIKQVFSTDYWGQAIASPQSHKSYRPLTTLTFWLNYQLNGEWTLPYHMVNIVLHVLASVLVYLLVRKIRCSPVNSGWDEALVAASAFAVHPVHSEAVANISGRAELLMSVFVLAALLYYHQCLQYGVFSKLNVVVFSTLIVLATFSKEQGITALPICIAMELMNGTPRKRSPMARCCFLLLFAGVLVFLRLYVNNFTSPKFTELDNAAAFVPEPLLRLASYSHLWLINFRLLILPYSLCFDYSMGCIPVVQNWTDFRALALPTVLAIVLGGTYVLLKTNDRLFCIGAVIGVITFLPASNLLITVGFTVAERRCEEWRTELDLYASGLRVCSQNAKVHYNLGKVLSKIGDVTGAEHNYWNAIRLNPNYEHAMNNLANILEAKGRSEEAEILLRKALRGRPMFAVAWMNLGITLMNQGRYEEALKSFDKSIQLRPTSADCFFNLGNLYQKMGKTEDALRAWKRATTLDPHHTKALTNLFVALDEREECNTVVAMAKNIPDEVVHQSASLAFQIGVCLGKTARFVEAERHLKIATQLNPHNAIYHANLGVLYQRWARYDLAEDSYLKALLIDSEMSSVTGNLQAVKQRLNKTRTIMESNEES